MSVRKQLITGSAALQRRVCEGPFLDEPGFSPAALENSKNSRPELFCHPERSVRENFAASCHPERSARKVFPTRRFCGSGGRAVEGSPPR